MAERVLNLGLQGVTLVEAKAYMYDYPWGVLAKFAKDGETKEQAAERVLEEFKDLYAPPMFDRPVNMQEIETILCRYGKYLKGGYYFGKDREVVIQNLNWRPNKLSQMALEGIARFDNWRARWV